MEGWFLYAEGGTRKDENNDGKDDLSKAALPLLIGGIWKGGTKDYKLEPISPSAAKPGGKSEDAALEDAIIAALPDAMLKTGTPKRITDENARANIPLIRAECTRAGITDARTLAYILVTAAWESFMGGDMDENYPRNVSPVTYFNKQYANRNGNGDVASGDGYRFRGRGFVQLTGRSNYARATKRCKEMDFKVNGTHPDLVRTPDLVATNKPLAALILVMGMKEGWFTGVGLDKFTKGHTEAMLYPKGKLDFDEARWIVNGKDAISKAPMTQASESLSGTIDGATQKDDQGKLEELSDLDYSRIRGAGRDGLSPKEMAEIKQGKITGSLDGVAGYYNGSNESTTWESHYSKDGFYYGEKWQCVEFVRRYYYDALQHKIPTKGDARKWFTPGLEDGAATFDGLKQYNYAGRGTRAGNDDGFSVKPQKGDILVLQTGSYGHVAVVADVSDTNLKIAQQNVVDDGFITDIPIVKLSNGSWRLSEKSPLALLRKA